MTLRGDKQHKVEEYMKKKQLVISANRLSFSFSKETVLKNITLSVERGSS